MEDPSITKKLDDEDQALKSLLDAFGSAFSLEEIASAFCKAGRDTILAGDILSGMQTGPPADATHLINSEISSKTPNHKDYDMSCDNPASVGVNSSFSKKEHVGSVAGSNKSPNVTKPLKVEAHSVAPVSNRGKNCIWRVVGSNGTSNATKSLKLESNNISVPISTSSFSQKEHVGSVAGSNKSPNVTKPLKVEAHSVASVSNWGKSCVWRVVGSNGTSNATKSLKLESNNISVPISTPEEPLLSRGASLSSSDRSSSASDVSSNDDIENILFEMLGHGSLMERSAIREVLGNCGYDMKKSMETLLDQMSVTLDRRNLCERSNLHSNSKSHSSENLQQPVQKQRISSDSCEQADLIVSAPVPDSATRSSATRRLVNEPLNVNSMKDDAQEGSYENLRKAVKEHRETMKEYYKAATEALSRGDRSQATILLEKGHFFYNKAREADEESVSKIFETREDGERREEISLDLQDHDAKEAIRLVRFHCLTLSGIPTVRYLKLIFGTGDQDAEKHKRMVSRVTKLLQKEAIRWTEDETSSAILIRLDEINPKSLSFGNK